MHADKKWVNAYTRERDESMCGNVGWLISMALDIHVRKKKKKKSADLHDCYDEKNFSWIHPC